VRRNCFKLDSVLHPFVCCFCAAKCRMAIRVCLKIEINEIHSNAMSAKHRNPRVAVLCMLCRHRHTAAVVISCQRHRQHFQVAIVSDRLHCHNVQKLRLPCECSGHATKTPALIDRHTRIYAGCRVSACFSFHVRRATAQVDQNLTHAYRETDETY